MSADMVSIGYTVKRNALPTIDAAKAIFQGVMEAVMEKRDQIDLAGRWAYFVDGGIDPEENPAGYEDALRDEVFDHLVTGMSWILDAHREQSWWGIPDYEDLRFVTSGGMTWGDDPFDEFEDVQLVILAVESIPALGPALGILGGGIQTTFPNGDS